MNQELFSIWQGVYSSFSEAGGDLDVFDSDIWIKKQKDGIDAALAEAHQNGRTVSKDYPLPIAVGMLLSQKKPLKILDFGGGMGLQYLDCHSKIPEFEKSVEYYIVDGKSTLDNRPKELSKFGNLHFLPDFTSLNLVLDIIHIGSTLQYVENWKSLLKTMMEQYQPAYLVFSDLLIGDVPSFVSQQVFYDRRIPNLFINQGEFLNFMKDVLGMKVLFKTNFISRILSQEDVFPNFGLPENYRIDRPYNLIFTRSC